MAPFLLVTKSSPPSGGLRKYYKEVEFPTKEERATTKSLKKPKRRAAISMSTLALSFLLI